MPFFSGFAQGASQALTTMRQEQQRQNEADDARQQQALLHLTNSEDPDTAAAAATALLHPKPPGGGFLKNLYGMRDRPEFPTLRGMITATRGGGQASAGGGGSTGAPPTAEAPPESAALPAGSPVEPSGPQMPVSAKVAGQTMGQPTPTPAGGIQAPALATGAAAVLSAATPPPTAPGGTPTASQPPPSASGSMGLPGWNQPTPMFATKAYTDALDIQKARGTQQADIEGKLTGLGFIKGPTGWADPQGKPIDPTLISHLMGLQPHYVLNPNDGSVTTMIGTSVAGRTEGVGGLRGPAEQREQQAHDLLQANPNLTLAEARTQVGATAAGKTAAEAATAGSRATTAAVGAEYAAPKAAAGLAQTEQATATGRAREQSLIASTVATWQRVHGTTPPSPTQRVNMAREILGTGPEILSGDVSRMADAIGAQFGQGAGRGPTTPPPPGVPPSTPPPPAGRGRRPAAGAQGGPPPSGSLQGATDATGMGDTVRTPKYYSAAGRQTVTAISAVERLLPKIEATIQQSGLADSNNPIPEKIASVLYGLGISPGQDMEALLQNAGMSKAYGLRGLLGGRSNTQLQGIYGQHLIDQGDSPKLILQKIHTLQANIPDIRAAVDEGESARVGGKGKSTTPPPTAGHPEGQRGTLNGQPVVWETRGGTAGWWPVTSANGTAAAPIR